MQRSINIMELGMLEWERCKGISNWFFFCSQMLAHKIFDAGELNSCVKATVKLQLK